MISSIFELGDKEVREVMIPRTDIVALDVTTPPNEVLEQITRVGHSRLPVYEGSADDIIGILYVKDLFRRLARGDRNIDLRRFLRPAHFVPESKKADDTPFTAVPNRTSLTLGVSPQPSRAASNACPCSM